MVPIADRATMPTFLRASALPPAASCRVSDADSLKEAKRALASSFASWARAAGWTRAYSWSIVAASSAR